MRLIIVNLIKSTASFSKVILLSKFRNILISGYKSNDKCIILGNGPSLIKSVEKNKEILLKYDLVCVNNFVKSNLFEELKPRFYILSASVLFMDDKDLSELYINIRNDIFKNLAEKTSWDIYLMIPFTAKKCTKFQHLIYSCSSLKPIYFNQTPVEGFSFFNHLCFGKGIGMPRPHNILIPAIMNCIYLNYKEIYLLGADHSWLPEISVNERNEALVNQKHFYDEIESKPEKMQDYISRPRKLHEIIHKFYLTFKGYWEIKSFAEKQGVKIYNSSETSMIDAFDRIEIESIK